ncbi:MAG: alkaline phosphatase family protein [Flavobacteriales bacterium]|nr:alkaline phosphatase family protein [Flavobacteriales bacterium]
MKLLTFTGLVALLLLSSSIVTTCDTEVKPPKKDFRTKNVIVLVIDGPRFSETFGDSTCQYIPHLAKDLAPQGVLFTNFRNNGKTNTNSGHTAITTGVYQSIRNDGTELPKYPSFFQYYLKEKKIPKEKAWIIASKGKLNILANARKKGWFHSYMPSDYCGPRGNGSEYVADKFTWDVVLEKLKTEQPSMMLINLLEVDTRGHSNDWPNYLGAIERTDKYAYKLWKFIQNSKHYKDNTTLIITNDHGRHLDGHKDGFVSHGDRCEGCRKIYMIGLGPDFKQGEVVTEEYEQIDISATIAHLMNFEMPTSDGRVITPLFK